MKTNKIQLEDGVRIKPYIKIKSLYQNQNVSTWRGKFIINGKRKTYSANPSEDKDDAFITINQKIYDELSGKVVKKRQTKAPTLTEIAKAYLAASKSQVSASQETRKNYLASLRNITAVITSGREPVFVKQNNGRYEVSKVVIGTGFISTSWTRRWLASSSTATWSAMLRTLTNGTFALAAPTTGFAKRV